MTVSLTINETLKRLSSLPILMQESFWWWQCSDRYIISLSPTSISLPFSPSLISLVVSVDVKHHVYTYLFGGTEMIFCGVKQKRLLRLWVTQNPAGNRSWNWRGVVLWHEASSIHCMHRHLTAFWARYTDLNWRRLTAFNHCKNANASSLHSVCVAGACLWNVLENRFVSRLT